MSISRRSLLAGLAALPTLALIPRWANAASTPSCLVGLHWSQLNKVTFYRQSLPDDFISSCVEIMYTKSDRWFCGAEPHSILLTGVSWERRPSGHYMRVSVTHGPAELSDIERSIGKSIYSYTDLAQLFAGWELVGYLYREG